MKLSRIYNFLTRSTCKIILERNLKSVFSGFTSKTVLEVGGNRDSNMPHRIKASKYVTLDITPASGADYIADATDMPIRDNTFDIVLCTEVLEHVRDYQKLTDEAYRVLKKDGSCILSTRFLYKVHDAPGDYFRFTEQSLKYIFRNFRDIEIKLMGNKFTVFWDLLLDLTFPLVLLNVAAPLVRMIFFWDDKDTPSGYLVRAKK